jgi:Spy/CpxP family protein refolding chaperone
MGKGTGKWTVGLTLMAAIAVSVAGAQGPDGMPGMGPHRPPMERAMGPGGDHGRWWNEQKAIDKLKLTDTQRKAMDDIYQQHRVTLVDLHAALEKEELAMEPLIQADQPNEARVLQQIDKVAQARAELEKANARMLLGIRRQLSPEQWKQIEADRAARHERGPGPDGRRFRGPGPGPGAGPDGTGPGTAPSGSGPSQPGSGPGPEPGSEE